jgi:hypothetical protein
MPNNPTSACVKVVESRWFNGVQLVCLTHSRLESRQAWGQTSIVAPMFSCELTHLILRPLSAFNSYVFHLSTLSTSPIKITTKYIKELYS